MIENYEMSDQELEQMYQEVILDASKHPHGKISDSEEMIIDSSLDALEGFHTVEHEHEYCVAAQSRQFNPTCGDTATVYVEISNTMKENDYRIEKIIWQGQGCSISQASLSIMVDLVQNKSVEEALQLARDFRKLMDSRGEGLNDEASEALGDAVVFAGVSKYPMRIKCALLGWEGMKASVAEAMSKIKTDLQ